MPNNLAAPTPAASGPATSATATSRLTGRRFATILLDMDGTLVDSTAAVVRSWITWTLEHDIDPRRLEDYHGVPAATIVRELVADDDVEAATTRIDELELLDVNDITVLPGAAEALSVLPTGRAAIVTSCVRPLADARIGAARLQRPSMVVTTDEVEHGKPHPEPFLLGAARLNVDPADCLIVEDAPNKLAAARAAGMATLAVTTTTPREQLDADVIMPTLANVRLIMHNDGVKMLTRT